MSSLVLGLDFGTESVRAVIIDAETGALASQASASYKHGVMDRILRFNQNEVCHLEPQWALQNAQDYIDAMETAIRMACLELKSHHAEDVIAIGVDFTASTPLPIKNGLPLSHFFPENPHAYTKLWKHHAAQKHADFFNRNAPWELLSAYGGKISCEWSLPKLLQFSEEAPELFCQTDYWIEAGDWIVSTLLGQAEAKPVRSHCQAGYKGLWSEQRGYPSPAFLKLCSPAVASRFENLMGGRLLGVGKSAGQISPVWAQKFGFSQNVVIASASIDAHAGVIGSGVCSAGDFLCVIGTSTCHMALDRELHLIAGVAGAVPGGIVPGLIGYEAGQAAVGDLFSWCSKISNQSLEQLESKASELAADAHGLTVLDWWNGSRTPYMDSELKGTIAGMTLNTTIEEIYLALIEATALGTRFIFETMNQGGLQLKRIVLSGGIAAKSPLLCQVYANVMNLPVEIITSSQPVARGAAIYALSAAKPKEDFQSLVRHVTAETRRQTISPQKYGIYEETYKRYLKWGEQMRGFYHE